MLHAAETNGLLQFVVEVLLAQYDLPNKAWWLGAGESLVTLMQAFRTYPVEVPAPARRQLLEATKQYFQCMHALGVAQKPKDHALLHLVARVGFQGAPSLYGNWLDEDINRHSKAISASAHSRVWESAVLCAFRPWKTDHTSAEGNTPIEQQLKDNHTGASKAERS